MSRLALRIISVAGVIALLGVGSYAIAGGGTKNFDGSPLSGYEENPDVSTVATGAFDARLARDGNSLTYELSYSGLEGTVQQAHVHFGKTAINGGISFFLCTNLNAVTTDDCPQSGTVTGEIDSADVIGPAPQGIEVGNLAEIVAAMRAGHAYANVHSSKWPGGEIRAQINNRGDDDDD
ncbi:MAG TPA: CHRD domain-containing protein [Gaiellaceae bacterium]|nr:CHRD domain-containing protein [Gaiellaceae bacterium]